MTRRSRSPEMRQGLGAMHVELGRYLWAGGDLVGGVEAMERALTIMPHEPEPGSRAGPGLAGAAPHDRRAL